MKIKITDPEKTHHLSIILRNLKLFVDNISMRFSNDGLHIQTLDQGQCCLLDLHISCNWFDTYEYSTDDLAVVSVNTSTIQKVISTRATDQSIDISVNDDTDYLHIYLSDSKDTCDKLFKIPLVDLDVDLVEPTINDSDVDLIMPTRSFTTLIKQLQEFSNTLHTHFTDESISFEAHGVDGTMTAKVDLEHDATEYSITEELELRQQFGLKYIEFMHSFGGLATEINMYFSENQPFHAKYNLAEGAYMSFYLAPMIDE